MRSARTGLLSFKKPTPGIAFFNMAERHMATFNGKSQFAADYTLRCRQTLIAHVFPPELHRVNAYDIADKFIQAAELAGIDEMEQVYPVIDGFMIELFEVYGYGERVNEFIQYIQGADHDVMAQILKKIFFESKHIPQDSPLSFMIRLQIANLNDNGLFPDLIEIGNFLLQPELVEPYLDQLEQDLKKYAETKLSEDDYRLFLTTAFHDRKILSGFLYQWAKQEGFKGSAKILTMLNSDKFLDILKDRLIIKDKILSLNHGEWPHAIQAYLICEHQKKTGFLTHHPVGIYAAIGEQGKKLEVFWDMFFDSTKNESAFCSPEYLTKRLTEQVAATRWRILHRLIKRTNDKMLAYAKSKDGISALQGRMKKKHPDEYASGVVKRFF